MSRCNVPGCTHNIHSSGLCQMHYTRIWRDSAGMVPAVTAPMPILQMLHRAAVGCWRIATIPSERVYWHRRAKQLEREMHTLNLLS